MRIDLHVHTSEGSTCALSPAARMLAAAAAAGLDAIAVTDHHQLVPAAQRREWNRAWAPLRVLGGIEISLEEDVLVLGLDDPQLERPGWTWPDLHEFVRDRGGLLVLAHPYRYNPSIRLDVDAHPPDAIEAWSSNLPPRAAARIQAVAARLGVPVLADSDAHEAGTLGRWYNELAEAPVDEAGIWDLIRAGRFRPHAPGLT